MTPLLKELLTERHLHEYSAFSVEYRRVARELELPRSADPPTKATYYNWLGGNLRDLPRGYHCLVLEQMFPGWTAKDLFSSVDIRRSRSSASRNGLLGSIAPALAPEKFEGLWCTSYIYEDAHHVDVTTVTVENGALTARNTPPAPRTEGRAMGFHNDINFSVVGRHLIGQWLNTSDSYYFGSVHLAALPGETVLDGMYSAIVSDSHVVAGRWRWVRIEPRTALGIDLTTVSLADPNRLHSMLFEHDPYSRPIPLAEILEDPR